MAPRVRARMLANLLTNRGLDAHGVGTPCSRVHRGHQIEFSPRTAGDHRRSDRASGETSIAAAPVISGGCTDADRHSSPLAPRVGGRAPQHDEQIPEP